MNINITKSIFIPRYNLTPKSIKTISKLSTNSIKRRVCWECGTILSFWDYCRKHKYDHLEKMVELWQNDYIELYCCGCFDAKRERLLKKYRSILNESTHIKKKTVKYNGY